MVKTTKAALVLVLIVIVLGAYTRLVDAGLGCPDWPGCYGQLVAPTSEEAIDVAEARYPERPVEVSKAWTEMVHRYAAGTLGLLIAVIAFGTWRQRKVTREPLGLPFFLVALVIFQALLGMWTVTLTLHPTIVMLHLLGGMATLALLTWLWLRKRTIQSAGSVAAAAIKAAGQKEPTGLQYFATIGLVILVLQIALGGWTSANYAALACLQFPLCHGSWWPPMDVAAGFKFWLPIGEDYEYGHLPYLGQVAVHMMHRVGAVITLLVLVSLSLAVRLQARRIQAGPQQQALQYDATLILLLVFVQFTLGMLNIWLLLPLSVAVAHNGVAALLLLYTVKLNYDVRQQAAIASNNNEDQESKR